MDTPLHKLRNYWAKRFPEMSNDWPYWWVEGDGYCLSVIDGNNLAAAVDMVEDNWERFDSIKVYKAKCLDVDLIRKAKSSFEISKHENSTKMLEDFKNEYPT